MLYMSTSAFATDPGVPFNSAVTGTVTAGVLTMTVAAGYTFTGTIGSTALFTTPFSVSDLRGSATPAGWNVTLTETQFVLASNPSFLTTALTMTGATATCATSTTCSTIAGDTFTNGVTGPIALPSGATAVKIISAPVTVSSGVFNVLPSFSVAIPGNAGAGAYTSTFTFLLTSGP